MTLVDKELKSVSDVHSLVEEANQKFTMQTFVSLIDSLRPINNLSVIKGRVFLGLTITKLGLMCLAQ